MALSTLKKLTASLTIPGTPVFHDFVGQTNPGVLENIISVTVPSTKTRQLHQVIVCCRINLRWRLLVNSTVIGSGRTGAAHPVDVFSYIPSRSVNSNSLIQLEVLVPASGPVVDLEAYIQAADI